MANRVFFFVPEGFIPEAGVETISENVYVVDETGVAFGILAGLGQVLERADRRSQGFEHGARLRLVVGVLDERHTGGRSFRFPL